jgi:site-specific DNA-methyltransferase (adenine-specific)
MRDGFVALADAVETCAILPPEVWFDVVYLDPPYGVGVTMAARLAPGQARGRRKADSGPKAYEDRDDPDALAAMLATCVAAIRDRMAPTATLYLHLDHRAVHEVKVAADRVLGRGAFLGEIVWSPGNGARGARGFAVTHQTILRYARSPADARIVTYNADDPALREPFAATSLEMHFRNVDADGRHYRERVINGKAYRYYADEGRRLGSVWTDIPAMVANTPLRREGTGYPTQKPEALLERIIKSSSKPGEMIADLMCGSGTAAAVASRLGRGFVAGDSSELAIGITEARLAAQGSAFTRIACRG